MALTQDMFDRVSARLRMAQTLIEHIETIAGPDLLVRHRDGRLDHAVRDHDALVNYLLLTCFDVLGQPEEYITFQKWLVSSSTRGEREAAVASLPSDSTPIGIAHHLADEHRKLYGVKRAFVRFINERLPSEERTRLLNSITIEPAPQDLDRAKTDFLFNTRNGFTHSAEIRGNAWRGLAPPIVMVQDGHLHFPNTAIAWEDGREFSVLRWPYLLYEIVANYIQVPVPDFNVVIDIYVQCKSGRAWYPPKLARYSDLARASEFQAQADLHDATLPSP